MHKTLPRNIHYTYLNGVGVNSAIQVYKMDNDIEMQNFPVIEATSLHIPRAAKEGQKRRMLENIH